MWTVLRRTAVRPRVPLRGCKTQVDRSNWPPLPPSPPPPPPSSPNRTYPVMVALTCAGGAFIVMKEKDNMSIVDLSPQKDES